ncbi:MAG: hypothetical protein WCD89_21460 [Anaerocolumna sp.]
MPYFTVNTSLMLDDSQKREIISFLSDKTNECLNIFLDKIQVTIQLRDRECFGKAGASLGQQNFGSESRVLRKSPHQCYYSTPTTTEEMVIIELDMWKNSDAAGKKKLFDAITEFFKSEFSLPGDNILILIRDMPPKAWIQNGIYGDDPLFLEKSRQY